MLLESLSEPGDVAVAEDAEAPGEEGGAHPVALHVLGGQEAHQCLGHGHLGTAHHTTSRANLTFSAPLHTIGLLSVLLTAVIAKRPR